MRVIIIEDEPPIAEDIEAACLEMFGDRIRQISVFHSLEKSSNYLETHPIDLCLLDLNLHGENGYEILKQAACVAFKTIVISAYTNQAIEAFELGVIDFVPKPFSKERLKKAFERYLGITEKPDKKIKYFVIRRQGKYHLISLRDICYFRSEGYLVEVHLKSGKSELTDKSLSQLEQILPDHFIRIHRSYIVDLREVVSYYHNKGGLYHVILKDETVLPLGRKYNRTLKNLLIK